MQAGFKAMGKALFFILLFALLGAGRRCSSEAPPSGSERLNPGAPQAAKQNPDFDELEKICEEKKAVAAEEPLKLSKKGGL